MTQRVVRRRRLAGLAASAVVLLGAAYVDRVGAFQGPTTSTTSSTTVDSTATSEPAAGGCTVPTLPNGRCPLDTTTSTAPTTSVTPSTIETSTSFETTTTEVAVEPIPSTTAPQFTTSTNLLIPGDGTRGAESTTTTTPELDEAGGGISDGAIVWMIVGGLLAIAALSAFLTWRYWRATKPALLDAATAANKPAAAPHSAPGTA